MIVEAEEPRVRKCLRHDDGRGAMAATDIGDAGASSELGLNPVARRNPLRDHMRGVARPEEAPGAAETAGIREDERGGGNECSSTGRSRVMRLTKQTTKPKKHN